MDIVVVDSEGDAVRLGLWDIPQHGSAQIVNSNRIYYQPKNDYVGVDTFTVRAYDSVHKNRSNVATVTITVRDDPTLRPSQTHSWGQFVIGFVKPPLDVDTDPGAIGDVAQIANPSAGHNTRNREDADNAFNLALHAVIQEPEVGKALARLLGFGDTFSFSEEAVEYMAHFLSNRGTITGVDVKKLLGTDNGAWSDFSDELFAAATFGDSMSHAGDRVYIIDSGAKLVTTTSSRWRTALGQFTAWMDGKVEHVESRIANGTVQLHHTLKFTWHVWDPYDWDPTNGGFPLRLARLHLAGLAKQFMVVGEFKGTISWWDGDPIPEFRRPWGGDWPS